MFLKILLALMIIGMLIIVFACTAIGSSSSRMEEKILNDYNSKTEKKAQ